MELSIYKYDEGAVSHTQSYLLPSVLKHVEKYDQGTRIFELGFGNGANAIELVRRGYDVVGVDPSDDGSRLAKARGLNVRQGSTEEDLAAEFGTFPILLSLEVIEHVYSPKLYASRVYDLLEPGGIAIISTPYHSYFKNLVLAATGKMERHFTALWEGGHIKFFSRATMGRLFAEAGMEEVDFMRVGRFPQLAKSMIGVYRKPK